MIYGPRPDATPRRDAGRSVRRLRYLSEFPAAIVRTNLPGWGYADIRRVG